VVKFESPNIIDIISISAKIWVVWRVALVAHFPHPEKMEVRVSANIMALVFLHRMSQEETCPLFQRMDHSYR
jgi:hypothetical protein